MMCNGKNNPKRNNESKLHSLHFLNVCFAIHKEEASIISGICKSQLERRDAQQCLWIPGVTHHPAQGLAALI